MADGSSGNIATQAARVAFENVVKPIAAGMKDMGQIAVESITSSTSQTQDPADQSQTPLGEGTVQDRKQDEEKRKTWALRVIDWHKKVQEDQMRVRQQNAEKERARLEVVQQDKQVQQFKIEKKDEQNVALVSAQRTREQKNVGAG